MDVTYTSLDEVFMVVVDFSVVRFLSGFPEFRGFLGGGICAFRLF